MALSCLYVGFFVLYERQIRPLTKPVKDFSTYGETFLTFRHLTPAHMKAARALLDWTQDRLAQESGLAASTIKRLENGGLERASLENIDRVSGALSAAGIEFFNGGEPGVRLRRLPRAESQAVPSE
ncbi:helix-turn-helix domain-containing protein (plasmid) [Aureimonas ureilytica]|uniref:helix-turn-helix domain-containing protein n=1 Tax=Aureimonas ureilytica TaxID=401562 RepID=UPI003CF1AED5